MATGGTTGVEYKVTGSVDSTFTTTVQTARDQVAKADEAGRAWKVTLASVQQALSNTGKSLGSMSKEQRESTKNFLESTKVIKEQLSALPTLEGQTKRHTSAVREAAAAQRELQTETKKTHMTVARLFEGVAGGAAGMMGPVASGVGGLVRALTGIEIPFTAVQAAAEVAAKALDHYAEQQIKIGERLKTESALIQAAATAWHTYGNAIARASGGGFGFSKPGAYDEASVKANLDAVRATIGKMSPIQAARMMSPDSISSPLIDQISAGLQAAKAGEALKKPTLEALYALQRQTGLAPTIDGSRGVVSTGVARQPVQASPGAVGMGDLDRRGTGAIEVAVPKELQEYFQGSTANAADVQAALNKVGVQSIQASQARAAAEATLKKLQRYAIAMDRTDKSRDQVEAFSAAVSKLTDKSLLGTSADFTVDRRGMLADSANLSRHSLSQAGKTYEGLTGGNRVDTQSLLKAIQSSNPMESKLAKDLLAQHADWQAKLKAIQDFDIGKNKALIRELEEGLAERRAMGKSAPDDALSTIKKELALVDPDDKAGRTALLNRQAAEQKAQDLESLHKALQKVTNDYKELAATGTATSTQLAAANKKVADAAKAWHRGDSSVDSSIRVNRPGAVDQQVRDQVEQVLSGTRAESGRIQQKSFAENLFAVRTAMGDRDSAATSTRDKYAANEASIKAVNDAATKGLITQQQKLEEINALNKTRAALEKQIANNVQAQERALTATHVGLSGDRLARVQKAIDDGKGGLGADQQKLELTRQVLQAKLDLIEQEYRKEVELTGETVLAAERASLEKKRLYETEAEAYRAAEDRKTAALKAAQSERLGGPASPLVGASEGVAGSGLGVSGFAAFGDNFGKFSLGQYRSPFDTYASSQLPGSVGKVFGKQQAFEGAAASAQAPNVTNVHLTMASMPPDVHQLAKQVGKRVAEEAHKHKQTVGTGAPAMTKGASPRWPGQ